MDFPIIILLSCLGVLVFLVLSNLVKEEMDRKKNPHLSYDFLSSLARATSEESPIVYTINDRLSMHLSFDLTPNIEVFAKDNTGEFVLVESKYYGWNSQRPNLKFEGPWQHDISEFLKVLYVKKTAEEKRKIEDKYNKIENIKNNWN